MKKYKYSWFALVKFWFLGNEPEIGNHAQLDRNRDNTYCTGKSPTD